MRAFASFIAAAAAAAGLLAAPALAQTYVGTPLSPPDLQAEIVAAVASRLPEGPSVHVRDLRPSLTRGGHGYCGLVSPDATTPYQPFHVIAEEDGNLAVLILPDHGDPPGLARADAILLLTNLGCVR